MATRHDRAIIRLQKQVTDISDALANLQTEDDLRHLIQIIHRPGWTTPAELAYLEALLKTMEIQVNAIMMLRSQMLQGSAMVFSSQDPIPPVAHIEQLEKTITELSNALSKLKSDEDLKHLIQIIVRPGFTRPAELAFSEAIINQLKVQTATLANLSSQMVNCSEMVTETKDVVLQ
jgi:hypothetical protein